MQLRCKAEEADSTSSAGGGVWETLGLSDCALYGVDGVFGRL